MKKSKNFLTFGTILKVVQKSPVFSFAMQFFLPVKNSECIAFFYPTNLVCITDTVNINK